MNLTARQYEIVKFIWQYRKRNTLAPTLAEIAQELGISKVTVHEHISQLEKKGALEKERFLSRSTKLTRRMQRELERAAAERSRYVGLDDDLDTDEDAVAALAGNGASNGTGDDSDEDVLGEVFRLPLLGSIAAGQPLEAIEEREMVDVGELCQVHRANYLLRVKGDSMIEDGIHDGDYVLVERRNNAHDGETVVAILENNEATLKRLYREKRRFRLQPANETLDPIYVDKLEIRGVVVGVLRAY